MERTLVIIKPDGVEQKLVPEILRTFKFANLYSVYFKMYRLNSAVVEQLYSHLKPKIPQENFNSIIKYMTSGEVVVSVYEGENAVAKVRKLCGPTDPSKAIQPEIRAYSKDSLSRAIEEKRAVHNIIHSSESAEHAVREMELLGISLQ